MCVCNTIELFFEICGPERFLPTFHLAFDSDRLPHLVMTTKTKKINKIIKNEKPRENVVSLSGTQISTHIHVHFSLKLDDLLSRITERRSPVISNFPPTFNSDLKTKHKIYSWLYAVIMIYRCVYEMS